MKKSLWHIALLLGALLLAPVQSHAADYSADDCKKMGVFLSNFTELGFLNVDYAYMTEAQNPDMIRFGIRHNYINNFKSRIEMCENCKWGSLRIDGKYVQDTLKKYLDYDLKQLFTVENSDPVYHFDGKYYHFEGADGESVIFAGVTGVQDNPDGTLTMTGDLYNPDSEEKLGTFTAKAKPHTWNGQKTWALLELKSNFE